MVVLKMHMETQNSEYINANATVASCINVEASRLSRRQLGAISHADRTTVYLSEQPLFRPDSNDRHPKLQEDPVL